MKLRHKQKEPEMDYRYWVIQAGRGWGKTTTGKYWIFDKTKGKKDLEIGVITPRIDYLKKEIFNCKGDISDIREKLKENPLCKINRNKYMTQVVYTEMASKNKITYINTPNHLKGLHLDYIWIDDLFNFSYEDGTYVLEGVQKTFKKGTKILLTYTPPKFGKRTKEYLLLKNIVDKITYNKREYNSLRILLEEIQNNKNSNLYSLLNIIKEDMGYKNLIHRVNSIIGRKDTYYVRGNMFENTTINPYVVKNIEDIYYDREITGEWDK